MDAIEVDPKLFVTCRLCLEDLGQFQIVPSVQQQIKYCFGIEVEPFDGLPQLICIKCKEILKNFHAIKNLFCEKQANLIKKVLKKEEITTGLQPQQDTVSSSQAPGHANDSTKKKPKRKRTISSSSDEESEKLSHTTKSKKKKHVLPHKTKIPMPWKMDYKKWVMCKLCNTSWPSSQSMSSHMRCHTLLKEKYRNIFNRQCTVKMKKIDNQLNLTGLANMVVYNSNRIIEPGSPYSYVIYSKGDPDVNNFSNESEPIIKDSVESKESSDDDEIILNPASRKRRFISRSSIDTVVIESNSNRVLSDCEDDSRASTPNDNEGPSCNDQCISIDDSSDNESDSNLHNSKNSKQPMEAKLGDYKIVQGIISMCVNSYHKKNETANVDMLHTNGSYNKKNETQTNTESQLKHKVLSIGRKIINKQGFNCTGLLRYLEHKNLEIVWIAKPQSSSSKDTNYIRILTKLRDPKNKDENAGWTKISETCESMSVPTSRKSAHDPNESLTTVETNQYPVIDTSTSKEAASAVANHNTNLPDKDIQAKLDAIPAALYSIDSKASCSDLKKLLNANPVANPKQLPKKLGPGNESRSNKTNSKPHSSSISNDVDNYCMPIITSTTSLAVVPNKDQEQSGLQKSTDTPAPRIKVKPASELMSERTLNCLMKEQSPPVTSTMMVSQIDNVWPHNHSVNVFVPNMGPSLHVTSQPLPIVEMPAHNTGSPSLYQVIPTSTQSNSNDDYVILDSTDLPNTKTDSPFRYFKDLLQMHSLILWDSCQLLPKEFISIIKFKVVFKQDHKKEEPVMLCLSFLCLKNSFCLKFKDRNQHSLDINNISANWQWELLQIYRGDVSKKVLQNARKFGKETYDYTYNFFCLLNSIKCHKVHSNN
ncbi:uncharacterized protein LOC110371346 [Helicoverpa armigera]|uniref:uncharacterized protein LOC110371346 n=1 Tax=Helicoverpa armigera TaxID=29058 RepID=UPI003083B832